MSGAPATTLRILRIYHSGVVDTWRDRERSMRAAGARVQLVSSARWNEGGARVSLDGDEAFVVGVRTFGTHPMLFLYDPLQLWRELRAAHPDVIDIHEEPVSLAAAEVQLVARLAGRPAPFCLYSAQNIEKHYPVPFRWLERLALRRARAVHTCNDDAGRILTRKGFRGIVRNLGLGVDTHAYSNQRNRAAAVGSPLRVGYVGRYEERKGVHVLVDAVALVPDVELELIGAGSAHDALRAQIADLHLADRVTLHEHTPASDLPARYGTLDVLVVPSLDTPSWTEQFGRVAAEGMAAGLVVVASHSGALPEVVGDAGILVPPGDVDALAEQLRRLAHDPAERARLGAAARQRAERYSWPTIASDHLQLYREMLTRAV